MPVEFSASSFSTRSTLARQSPTRVQTFRDPERCSQSLSFELQDRCTTVGRKVVKRELGVQHFVVAGHTNREVSMSLGLTEHTASNCLLSIPGRVEFVLHLLKRQRQGR